MKWIKNLVLQIPIQLQLFLMGITPAIPTLVIAIMYSTGFEFSREFMNMFWFCFTVWISLHLLILWRLCHEPFHTLANQIRSIHQGDYSQRLIKFSQSNALSYLHDEINTLADELQGNRLAFQESRRRFQYLIDQIEIGVVAFDDKWRITMINQHMARLLDETPNGAIGLNIHNVNLDGLVDIRQSRTLWLNLPGKNSRYIVHTNDFRDEGRPQKLYLITDVNTQLREEERGAWKRLIRVLGHELNNSLTPIISLSNSLRGRFKKTELPNDLSETTLEALEIISHRADGMNRFVRDYAKLAKLPEPKRDRFELGPFISRISQLMDLKSLKIFEGPESDLVGDQLQLEQVFINILQNADQAIPEDCGSIILTWIRENSDAVVTIVDNGPGIEKKENLFVPFFSTKPGGSGIGLVLSQQIMEANGGSIEIDNVSPPETGCKVTLKLPLDYS